ncbi:MAG: ADOP family duplicated permease [Acidobacteriota bacterium]
MTWFSRLLRRSRMERQLDNELRFHIEQHTADLIARGHDSAEAHRRAQLELGGFEQMKEECRDARGTRWLEDLQQDLRYTLRMLRKRPFFAAVVVATLALGGGATTLMFTVINSVLLRPLAYSEPGRLVSVIEQTDYSTQYGNQWAFAYPNYLDCKRDVRTMTLGAWRTRRATVMAGGEPEFVVGRQVSAELFPLLGASLAYGRVFAEAEDRAGAAPVAIISHGLWQRLYDGSPSALAKPLVFDGKPYTVIGVTAPGFAFAATTDVFLPIGQDSDPLLRNREAHAGIQVWARLKPGATVEQAQTELTLIGRRLADQYPVSNKGRTFVAEPLRPFVGDVGPTLWLLLGAVSLVLLIACANIASLLLARAVSREREMALRAALGARRGRLIRQCLTESTLLGLMGGACGVLLAVLGISQFVAFWPGGLPRADTVQMDWRVLLFAVGVSLASGVLFGLAPALRVPAGGLDQTLRSGARTLVGRSRRVHNAFVVFEIAVTLVLLACAAVLGRTILRLTALDAGVDIQNVLVTRMALSPSLLNDPAAARAAWDDVLKRAVSVPGVKAIAMVDTVPMRQGNNQLTYSTSPVPPPADQQPFALATSVTPNYLEVMGIALRRGRFFDDRDRLGTTPVIVVDDVLAQQAFGAQNPIGRRLWLQDLGAVEVVGVVGHVRHWGFATDDEARVRAQLYYPFAQVPDGLVRRWSELMSIAVRTTVDPEQVLGPLRRELRGAAGDQVLYQVNTLDQLANGTLARQRFLLLLFSVFAGVALLLAFIGVYGVLIYLTNQRVPEFGVRLALGATATRIRRLVLAQSLGLIGIGVTIGLFAALVAGRMLTRLVEGVRTIEISTMIVAIAVVSGAALIASFVPALRASRVDATTALRQE